MLFSALSYPFSFFLCCSIQDLISLFYAVFTSYWHMEYRLHFCGDLNWEAFVSWKKCGPPVGFDDWSLGYSITWYSFQSMYSHSCLMFQTKLFTNGKHWPFGYCRFGMRRPGGTWVAWGKNSQYHFLKGSLKQILLHSNFCRGFWHLIPRIGQLLKRQVFEL